MARLDLETANRRLKAGGVRIRIYEKTQGWPLYLRGTLPPKPESCRTKPYQQWISTGCGHNTAGIQGAMALARRLDQELTDGRFDWDNWRKVEMVGDPVNTATAIRRFEREWFEQHGENQRTLYTWKKSYQDCFKHLHEEQLDGERLLEWIVERSQPNTSSRKRYCQAVKKLAESANLPIDLTRLKRLKGNYGRPGTIKPRVLPTDDEIRTIWTQLQEPTHKWFWGMMATFGLRNFECWFIDTSPLTQGQDYINVNHTKTGIPRKAWALPKEWVDEFGLRVPFQLPAVKLTIPHGELGDKVTHFFTNQGLPGPYNLRHAWRDRAIRFGVDPSVAAKSLGHSVQVSQKTYTEWITDQTCADSFRAAWRGGMEGSARKP